MRRRNDGQIGFMVEGEDGRLCVQLDRKAEKLVYPYSPHLWAPDETGRLTSHHIARIAYAADREFREARGEYGVKEFRFLPEAKRMAWMRGIPADADAERKKLYAAVVGGLG